MKRLLPCLVVVAATLTPWSVQAGRPLSPEDWFRFQAVSDLHIAPDGAAVAYLVTSYDKESDASRSALWMANWAGGASGPLRPVRARRALPQLLVGASGRKQNPAVGARSARR